MTFAKLSKKASAQSIKSWHLFFKAMMHTPSLYIFRSQAQGKAHGYFILLCYTHSPNFSLRQPLLMRLPFSNPMHLPTSRSGNPARWARVFFSWQSLGIVLFAVMLARWVWVFAAPADVAMPATTSWQKNDAAEDLFGHATDVDVGAVTSAGNIQLIGVFAHNTAGFAVLQIDGKQIGVGMGETAAPGMRLVETHADYVLLERGGVRQRVDLPKPSASPGITIVPASNMASTTRASGQQTLPRNTDLETIPPAQRAAMQQELDNFRRRH